MLFKKDKTPTAAKSRCMIYILNHFGKSRKISNQVTLQPVLINPTLTWILFFSDSCSRSHVAFNNQSCFLFILFNKAAITAKEPQATHSNSRAALGNISVKPRLMRYQSTTSSRLGDRTVSLVQISQHQAPWSNISQNIFPHLSHHNLKGVADNINVPSGENL